MYHRHAPLNLSFTLLYNVLLSKVKQTHGHNQKQIRVKHIPSLSNIYIYNMGCSVNAHFRVALGLKSVSLKVYVPVSVPVP